jgi:hypothetical protein
VQVRHIAWDVLIVSLGNDGILAKNVVYELWRHGNVFTAFRGPQPRINRLARFTLLLRVDCGMREQEMLGHSLGIRPKTQRRTSVKRARTSRQIPKLRLGDLTTHDQLAMKRCELQRLDQNLFANREIAHRVVNGRAMGTRDGLDGRGCEKVGAGHVTPLVAAAPPRPVVCGDCETPASRAARLLSMMAMSCALNVFAFREGERGSKREKWPFLSFSKRIWRRTCAAPSIEEKSAEGEGLSMGGPRVLGGADAQETSARATHTAY